MRPIARPVSRPFAQALRYVLRDLGPIAYEKLSTERALRAGLGAFKFAFVKGLTRDQLERVVRDLPDRDKLETQIMLYILRVYDVPPETLASALARAKPDRKGELMTLAERLIIQGRAEGEAKGKAEGKAEGKTDAILITLETRFGPLAAEMEDRVRRTVPEDLDALFRRALTAPSLEAAFGEDTRH